MSIKTLLATALIWSTFSLVSSNNIQDNGKAVEGTWLIVQAELGGKKLPDEGMKGTKLVLQDGKYQYLNDQGEYKLLPGEQVNAMDITGKQGPNEGKTFLAIYELKNDTLTICYDLTGKARPKEFKTETGTRQFLVTYQKTNK